METKRKERLSTRTTKKAADTTTIQSEYRTSVALASRRKAAPTSAADGTRPIRPKAIAKSASPPRTSAARHGANRVVETRNWASAGCSRTKSSVPFRIASTTAEREGFTAPSSTPFISVNKPTTTSASSKVQPAREGRPSKTTRIGTIDQLVQKRASSPPTRNSTRYCIAATVEARSWTPRSRRYLSTLPSHGGEPPDAEAPRRPRGDEQERDEGPLHRQLPRDLRPGEGPGHQLDGEVEHVPERQPARGGADPVRVELARDEVAGEDPEEAEPDVEEGGRRLEPEGERPDDRHGEERDHPRREDGRRKDREEQRIAGHALPSRREEEHEGDRHSDEEPDRQRGHVLARVAEQRVDRAQQLEGERPLPDLRVQLPDDPGPGQLPDDQGREVVGNEGPLSEPADRRVARHRRPEGQHHQRHVGGEDPDEELGAVGDRLGEADLEERGQRAEGPGHPWGKVVDSDRSLMGQCASEGALPDAGPGRPGKPSPHGGARARGVARRRGGNRPRLGRGLLPGALQGPLPCARRPPRDGGGALGQRAARRHPRGVLERRDWRAVRLRPRRHPLRAGARAGRIGLRPLRRRGGLPAGRGARGARDRRLPRRSPARPRGAEGRPPGGHERPGDRSLARAPCAP